MIEFEVCLGRKRWLIVAADLDIAHDIKSRLFPIGARFVNVLLEPVRGSKLVEALQAAI